MVRSIGVSNFNSQQLKDIIQKTSTIPVLNQVESHPILSNEKLFQFCKQRNIAMTAYSPLARVGNGIDVSPLEDSVIKKLAKKYKVCEGAVCIRWQTQRGLSVIPKSGTKERIKSNINVFHFTLTDDEIKEIMALNKNLRTSKHNRHGSDKTKNNPFLIEF
ncbi:unnamed protein product, partial [Oppiella nova]